MDYEVMYNELKDLYDQVVTDRDRWKGYYTEMLDRHQSLARRITKYEFRELLK